MRICDVDGCGKAHMGKGLCGLHYQRLNKRGNLEVTVMRGESPYDRVMAKVIVQPNGCWIFTGVLTENGYGHIRVGRTMRMAHVVTYELKYGAVPAGMELDHKHCSTRACCNPEHVLPATHLENIRRGVSESSTWGFARLSPADRSTQASIAAKARWAKFAQERELI